MSASLELFVKDKIPKTKVAIIFGYLGEKYHGLQWNHSEVHPTVEFSLLQAFHQIGLISDINMGPNVMQKLGWERASRTDKGVHALKNVISVRLMLPKDQGIPLVKQALNQVLDTKDIHIYEIIPVTKSFNAYKLCGGRVYEYFLPSFALMDRCAYNQIFPKKTIPEDIKQPINKMAESSCAAITNSIPGLSEPQLDNSHVSENSNALPKQEANILGKQELKSSQILVTGNKHRRVESDHVTSLDFSESSKILCNLDNNDKPKDVIGKEPLSTEVPPQSESGDHGDRFPPSVHWEDHILLYNSIPQDYFNRLSKFRINSDQFSKCRDLFLEYVGTKSFHNFTPYGSSDDPKVMRFIRSINVHPPEVYYSSKESSPGSVFPNGVEIIRLEIVGQSFMLNQIRKMIGAVCLLHILNLPVATLKELLSPHCRIEIPMVPANGLLLSDLDFFRYNIRLNRIKSEGNNATGRGIVDLSECNDQEVHHLTKKIRDSILQKPTLAQTWGCWMYSLRHIVKMTWKFSMSLNQCVSSIHDGVFSKHTSS